MDTLDTRPACLTVTGNDRVSFLQGQLTQDVALLTDGRMLPAAWCNPKGRVIALLTLVHGGDRTHLFLPAWQAAEFAERLLRYRLRSDVDLTPDEDVTLAAFDCGPGGVTLPEGAPVLGHRILPGTEPRVMEICARQEELAALGAGAALGAEAWSLAAIRAGRPALAPDTVEEFTPHMLNLDLLGAVSFRKGCYTGQEVIARTQNLGRPSRRMLRYASDAPPPAPGDRLLDETGEAVGTVIRSAGDGVGEFLAVVSIKRLGGALALGGSAAVRELSLPYAVPELATA